MEEAQKFGAKLRELRTKAGLTQRELAQKVSVDFTYLSKIENGVLPPPSEKVIVQLAEVLNADKDELITLAGRIPADIALILKDKEALQFLRSKSAQKKVKDSSKKSVSMPKLSIPFKSLYRVALPVFLTIAVAASLWYASPTKALEITITEPSAGTLGGTHTFTVKINIQEPDLVPITSVNLEIYNINNSSQKATLENLPMQTTAEQAHTVKEGSTSGSARVSASATTGWTGGYTYGSGYALWEGTGYSFGSVYGYGYGSGPTYIIYTVKWISPSNWSASNYKIDAKLTASSTTLTKTFTETSSAFYLSAPAAADGPPAVREEETTAEELEEMTDEEAAEVIEELTDEEAAELLEEVDTEKAAAVIEEVATDKAAAVIEEVATDKAADIIEEVATDKAADIIEEVATDKAADIIEEVATDKAADIIEEVSTDKAADILEEVSADKAADIMEELSTEKLNNTIPAMSEQALTERLPGMTAEKLHSVEPAVLFESLPNAPTEQLVSETPPEPPAELEDPVVVYTTPSGAKYLAIRTVAGEWVVIVGTPMPVDKLLIKTKKALKDVGTTIEIFEERPPGVFVDISAEKIVRAYITITLENATPEDVELGHMTFMVEKEWLEQNSIHKWSVALNRYASELNKWISLPTRRVKEDDTYLYYTASITHFSVFAITGSQTLPSMEFQVSKLAISPAKVEPGEAVTISADVTNIADRAGTYVATLWINGTVEAGKYISLEADKSQTVSFTVTRAAEGSYEVRFDRLFGSFSVTKPVPAPKPPVPAPKPPAPPAPPAPAPAPAPTPPVAPPAPPVTPINWWLIGGIIGAAIVIAAAVWLVVAYRRRAG